VSSWTRGAVASGAALLAVVPLAGCSPGPVAIDAPSLSGADAAACRTLVADLPDRLAGHDRVATTGDTRYGAAWGDPAIVLTCGVDVPASFDRFSQCVQVDGVGWYVPQSEAQGGVDATFTTVGYRPRVALRVPVEDQPEGGAAALAALARAVRTHLELVRRCR